MSDLTLLLLLLFTRVTLSGSLPERAARVQLIQIIKSRGHKSPKSRGQV